MLALHQNTISQELYVLGFDRVGAVNDIIEVVSSVNDLKVGKINFEVYGASFSGKIHVETSDASKFTWLIQRIYGVEGVVKVQNA